jgi:hypothetical protein
MDPYLEDPAYWRDFHARLINACSEVLADRLPPGYEARIEEQIRLVEQTPDRTTTAGRLPDVSVTRGTNVPRRGAPPPAPQSPGAVATLEPIANAMPLDIAEVRDSWIEVLHRPEREIVAVVEILSPTNKTGEGYVEYRAKRRAILERRAHLVEIDLLVGGERIRLRDPLPPGDYFAFVTREQHRPRVDVYPWSLRDALPTIPVPLKPPDPDVGLDLADAFRLAYHRGRYTGSLPYDAPPPAPLPPDLLRWARTRAERPSEEPKK